VNPEGLAVLEHWIRERHLVWHRREVLRQPPPWTGDDVLASTFFTNVHRTKDPGTKWLIAHVNAHRPFEPMDAVMNVLAYRMALSEAGKAAMGWVPFLEMQERSGKLRERLKRTASCFTPAYMVRSNPGSKVDSIVDSYLLQEQGALRSLGLNAVGSRSEFVEWASSLHGIGTFVAFQALVDLCYPEVGVLPWDNDGWVAAGPGTIKGLAYLYGGPADVNEKCQELCAELNPRLADLPDWTPVHRSDMTNCLCELSKYVRALEGNGARRRFRAPEAHLRDREARGFGTQLELI
jgi:hypothetical protein